MHRNIAGWVTHHWAKWVVVVLSLIFVGGIGGTFGPRLAEIQENDIASFLPGDAESTQVIAKSAQLGADPDAVPVVVLYVRGSGITPDDTAKVAADARAIPAMASVADEVAGPQPSQDGKALQLIATIQVGKDGFEDLPQAVEDIRDTAEKDANGLEVSLAGPAAFGADQAKAFAGIDGVLLLSALAIVFVLLVLTYRSPILWFIPLLCGVFSVFTAQGFVYLLARYADLTVNGQSAGILSVLVLGAGVDYALLIVARYREELHHYEDRHQAMSHALHRAAPAVLASGATVIIGLLCLMFAELNSTSGLGPVAAAGIAVALLMMLVLLPALLVVFGRWVFWPFIPRFGTSAHAESGVWSRVGRGIEKAPRAVWIGTTLALVAVSFGVLQLNATGLSNEDTFTTTQPSVTAEKELAKHYPGGDGSPVQVISAADRAKEVASDLGAVEGIDAPSVAVVAQKDGLALIQATLSSAPDSDDAYATIERARASLGDIPDADALVGGQTAINKDVQDAASADNRLIIPIILLAVLLILALLLRSIVAPVILLGTVVLSFAAALGISALVFRHVFGFPGADSSFPLFAFVFLVALGIDYNIFLMTRVREEALHVGTHRGALIALAATGGVITSAGLVLAGTFAALGSLPIVFLAELGFAVALGVLLDTIIVRSVLVTALNLDLGRWMWWPSNLWRTDGDEVADRP
ncbi:MAG: MMPL family transporter [Aeromicrobium sp.]|uniref:MMPL family transporter n=1 Tax=Aeromicrobium sp. TaxID=1871063 RepID=UPI003C5B4FE2